MRAAARLFSLCTVVLAACAAEPVSTPPARVPVVLPEPLPEPVEPPPLVVAQGTPPRDPFTATAPVTELSCSQEKQLRSQASEVSLFIDFENATDVWLALEWLNFDGKRVRYADLGPGESYRQQTYVTHPWVAVDPTGRCRGLFLPGAAGVHTVLIGGH